MSYTYDPATDRGKIRLLIHDTTDGTYGTDYDFTDADIDALLEQNSDSVWLGAADACRVLAAKAASSSFIIKLPGALELDRKQIAQVYLSLAERYESRASTGPDAIVEHIDSFAIGWDIIGADISEYVGD